MRAALRSGPAVLALAVLTCALTACTPADASGRGPATGPGPGRSGSSDLDRLTVAPEDLGSGYRRTAFGHGWIDVDRNGCSTRDDVLARDLTQVRTRGRCVVVAGVLVDPYTGRTVIFDKAHADRVQIDHVVSLAEAWRSGADRWTSDLRVQFANDGIELLATAAAVNDSKSDQDPGQWSPADRDRTCAYARRVVAVKARYGLTVDRRERDALAEDLAGCR